MAVQPKTVVMWDWIEVKDEVEERTGRDIRDWAGKYAKSGEEYDPNVPYQDFWHWLTDMSSIHNDSLETFSFEEMVEDAEANGEESWIIEVLKAFLEVVGPGEHVFHIWW